MNKKIYYIVLIWSIVQIIYYSIFLIYPKLLYNTFGKEWKAAWTEYSVPCWRNK